MAPERKIRHSRKRLEQTMDLLEAYIIDLPGRLRERANPNLDSQHIKAALHFKCRRGGVEYTVKASPNMPHIVINGTADMLDQGSQQRHGKTDTQLREILEKQPCQDAIQYGLSKRLVSDQFDWAYLTTSQGTIHGVELRGMLFAYSEEIERSSFNRSVLALVNHLKHARAFLHRQVTKFS